MYYQVLYTCLICYIQSTFIECPSPTRHSVRYNGGQRETRLLLSCCSQSDEGGGSQSDNLANECTTTHCEKYHD